MVSVNVVYNYMYIWPIALIFVSVDASRYKYILVCEKSSVESVATSSVLPLSFTLYRDVIVGTHFDS